MVGGDGRWWEVMGGDGRWWPLTICTVSSLSLLHHCIR